MANTPKFCRQCGYPLEEDARSCERCGAPTRGRIPPQSRPASDPTPTQPVATRGASLTGAIAVVLGAALLFLVVAALALYLLPALGWNIPLPWLPAVAVLPTPTPTAQVEATAAPSTAAPTLLAPTLTRPVVPTAGLPTGSPPLPAADPVEAIYQGVRFVYDPGLLTGYNAQTLPENPQSANSPFWSVVPEHIQITFDGYLLPDTVHTPALYVFPAADYAALSPSAEAAVAALTTLLRDRPAQVEDALPFLPNWNAAQVYHAQVDYLPFAGGSGVRYLTQFDQALNPVNNQDTFYTFQGLTVDGRYYVAAVFPVSHPDLPVDGEMAIDEYNALAARFPAYLSETVAMLDGQPDQAFTPSLNRLDALVRSLVIR